MTRKGIQLSVVAGVLGVIYVIFFTDLFRTQTIQIFPVIRPNRASTIPRGDEIDVYPVAFKLDGKYRLTSVKVVAADEFATNKYAVPLWHLIADKTSSPMDNLVYGGMIRGMKPKEPRARPEPLLPNVPYLLMLEAGSLKGQTNFFTRQALTSSR